MKWEQELQQKTDNADEEAERQVKEQGEMERRLTEFDEVL